MHDYVNDIEAHSNVVREEIVENPYFNNYEEPNEPVYNECLGHRINVNSTASTSSSINMSNAMKRAIPLRDEVTIIKRACARNGNQYSHNSNGNTQTIQDDINDNLPSTSSYARNRIRAAHSPKQHNYATSLNDDMPSTSSGLQRYSVSSSNLANSRDFSNETEPDEDDEEFVWNLHKPTNSQSTSSQFNENSNKDSTGNQSSSDLEQSLMFLKWRERERRAREREQQQLRLNKSNNMPNTDAADGHADYFMPLTSRHAELRKMSRLFNIRESTDAEEVVISIYYNFKQNF